jgi:hypothetical protein
VYHGFDRLPICFEEQFHTMRMIEIAIVQLFDYLVAQRSLALLLASPQRPNSSAVGVKQTYRELGGLAVWTWLTQS